MGKRKINCQLERINVIDKGPKMEVIDQDGNIAVEVLPRTRPQEYEEPKKEAQKRVWSFPISIWAKDFKFESEVRTYIQTYLQRKCCGSASSGTGRSARSRSS